MKKIQFNFKNLELVKGCPTDNQENSDNYHDSYEDEDGYNDDGLQEPYPLEEQDFPILPVEPEPIDEEGSVNYNDGY